MVAYESWANTMTYGECLRTDGHCGYGENKLHKHWTELIVREGAAGPLGNRLSFSLGGHYR